MLGTCQLSLLTKQTQTDFVDCLKEALKMLKIDDVLDRDAVLSSKPVLIGGGTEVHP